eukprot:Rmarinus@m.20896
METLQWPPSRCYICASLSGCSTTEMFSQMKIAKDNLADMLELRLDLLDEPFEVSALISHSPLPVIVTYRCPREGGHNPLATTSERISILIKAAQHGAAFVDVELSSIQDLKKHFPLKCRLIISYHAFDEPLGEDDLVNIIAQAIAFGADVVKVATSCTSSSDIYMLWKVFAACPIPYVAICLGFNGSASRVLSSHLGCAFTYAALSLKAMTAPGQIPVQRLIQQYRFRELTPVVDMFCVVGNPLGHTLSPVVHAAAFRARSLTAVYVALPGPDFENIMRMLRAMPFVRGASITAPHKVRAYEYASSRSPLSERVGAVNTLTFVRGPTPSSQHISLTGASSLVSHPSGREGHACRLALQAVYADNTDAAACVDALLDALPTGFSLDSSSVLVLGCGGAARAICVGLLDRMSAHGSSFGNNCAGTDGQALVTAVSRTARKAKAFEADLRGVRGVTFAGLGHLAASYDVVINATPVGTAPDTEGSPVPETFFTERGVSCALDVVYRPFKTRFIRDAEKAGCVVVPGIEMFVRQAAMQLEIWFPGLSAPVEEMREAALEALTRNEYSTGHKPEGISSDLIDGRSKKRRKH